MEGREAEAKRYHGRRFTLHPHAFKPQGRSNIETHSLKKGNGTISGAGNCAAENRNHLLLLLFAQIVRKTAVRILPSVSARFNFFVTPLVCVFSEPFRSARLKCVGCYSSSAVHTDGPLALKSASENTLLWIVVWANFTHCVHTVWELLLHSSINVSYLNNDTMTLKSEHCSGERGFFFWSPLFSC